MKMKISEYAKLKGVTYRTVWNWAKRGYVVIEKSQSGTNHVVFDRVDVKDPVYTAKMVEELKIEGGYFE